MSSTSLVNSAADLLFGYRPVWDMRQHPTTTPFFAPPVVALAPVNPMRHNAPYPTWDDYPTITIHDSPESLLSAVYAYRVASIAGDQADIQVPAGYLALDDADRTTALDAAGSFLGLDLSLPRQYMLVRVSRTNATITHPFYASPSEVDRSSYLSDAAKQAIASLKPAPEPVDGTALFDSRISKDDATAYLAQIGQLGTHFVTVETTGDLLFQVFAYDADRFRAVQTQFQAEATQQPDGGRAVSGMTAGSWAYWTSQANNGFGFVAAYGNLVCLSRDPQLATAIGAGQWKDGYVPAGTPSIFAYTHQYALVNGLTQEVPISVTLTPIAALISNKLVAGPWDRIVKGGLLQKWGDAVRVPVARNVNYDWPTLFPETVDSWSSGIVTPTVDVYQERVDLAQVRLLGADLVGANFPLQSFRSFSQVLQANVQANSGPIALPSDDITLVAQVIDTSKAAQTPVISMSAKALNGLTAVCEEMYGAIIFQSSNGSTPQRKVALDAVLFQTLGVDPTTERATVGICCVLADKPAEDLVTALKDDIQLSLVAAEALLHARGPNAETLRAIEVEYLRWLAGIIPSDTSDIDLARARAHALYLAEDVAKFGTDVVYVPYVTYESYRNYVSDMVREAQGLVGTISQYQISIRDTINSYKVLNSIANLNDNVKQIGGVLTDYFGALAAGQASMNGYYDQVLSTLNQQQQKNLADIKTLTTKLEEQRQVISHTGDPVGIVQTFQLDYADYINDLIAKCVFSAVSGLFDAALSMAAIPGEAEGGVLKALVAIKDTFDKIKAVTEVLDQVQAAQSAIDQSGALNDLSNTIATTSAAGDLKMPTQLDFQTLAQNVNAALANVPNDGNLNQDKANLVAAVNTLSDIGSALLQARASASQTAVEIANQSRLKLINAQQQARMSALTSKLHLGDSTRPPDIASIDLIGITGALQYQLKQVLSVLARTLELQDGAVQFEYFGDPAPITSFTLQNLLAVVSAQDRNALDALQLLDPQPQDVPAPITVTIKDIRAIRLTGSNSFRFQIQLNDPNFRNYDMVRIRRVVPRVNGIRDSSDGDYEISLACQATPFQDRDYTRTARTFATVRRSFGPYVYDVKSGAAKFGDSIGTFAKMVTQLTPFSTWEISVPGDRANNQGLKTDILVTVQLDFYITAHYDDPAMQARSRALLALRRARMPAAAFMLAADVAPGPTLASLEAQMYQNQEVLQGWDAAFSVLVGPVNAFLFQQFQQHTKDSNNLMTVASYYCENVLPFHGTYFTNVTKLNFQLSNPLLEFIPGNDSVTVTQNIVSGSVDSGTLEVAQTGFDPSKCQLVDRTVAFVADTATSVLTLSVNPVFYNAMQVLLSSTGTLPAPLVPNTDYWVVSWQSAGGKTTLQLSATAGGTPIVLTNAGTGTHSIAADIDWSDPVVVNLSKSPYVKGSVPLARIDGLVVPPSGQGSKKDTITVVLDFPVGAFTLNNFAVDPPNWDPDHHATEISAALANYFATNEIKYQVQTINLTNLNNDPVLTPTQFALNAATTRAGNNILQMLIATTGKVQNAHTIQVDEPVPYDPNNPLPGTSNYSASVMLSSKLTFEHVFVNNFNKNSTNLQVETVVPAQGFQAYGAKISQGSVSAVVPFKDTYQVRGNTVQYRISSSGNNLTWDLTGTMFSRSANAGIALSYSNGTASPPSGGTNVSFQYRQWFPAQAVGRGGVIPAHWGNWHDSSATAYVTMNGSYPLQVKGSDTGQMIGFTTTEPSVTFDKSSDLTPASDCDCNDNDVKIALLDALGTSVPQTLKTNMDQITFNSISVFALESLLFPADQLITMQQALVPGDLLVVGGFLNAVRKTAATYNVTISAASGAQGVFGGTSFRNGQRTSSVTVNNLPKSFVFQYGPIRPELGGLVTYTVDIEAGTVSPATILLVVDQPAPDNNPQQVILLPPGFGAAG
jgi:hypothetical protein